MIEQFNDSLAAFHTGYPRISRMWRGVVSSRLDVVKRRRRGRKGKRRKSRFIGGIGRIAGDNDRFVY